MITEDVNRSEATSTTRILWKNNSQKVQPLRAVVGDSIFLLAKSDRVSWRKDGKTNNSSFSRSPCLMCIPITGPVTVASVALGACFHFDLLWNTTQCNNKPPETMTITVLPHVELSKFQRGASVQNLASSMRKGIMQFQRWTPIPCHPEFPFKSISFCIWWAVW